MHGLWWLDLLAKKGGKGWPRLAIDDDTLDLRSCVPCPLAIYVIHSVESNWKSKEGRKWKIFALIFN